jgi:hypothetical protein
MIPLRPRIACYKSIVDVVAMLPVPLARDSLRPLTISPNDKTPTTIDKLPIVRRRVLMLVFRLAPT